MRSDTAFFSAADISRRFLAGLASDLLSAAAAAFVGGEEERRAVERAFGADAPRICSTSVNALISAWRRSISLWRLAIACAISFMALESSDPAMGMSTQRGQHPARAVRCIWFSGFASQGDGACFEGDWKHAPGTSRHIREYAPQDKTLHQIADALTRAQKRNFYQLAGVMRHEGHYSHEYCMKVDIERENEHHQEPTEDSVETVTKAMRELARWLYRHIETTWTDQTSDPIVDEEIHANEWAFTAKGAYFAA